MWMERSGLNHRSLYQKLGVFFLSRNTIKCRIMSSYITGFHCSPPYLGDGFLELNFGAAQELILNDSGTLRIRQQSFKLGLVKRMCCQQ